MLSRLFFPLDWVLSLLASVLRVGAGGPGVPTVIAAAPPVLYEFESCPFCRITREQVSAVGIVVHVKPCPKGGTRYRPDVMQSGGKSQYPYLIDANGSNGADPKGLYESADISRYLSRKYGDSSRPLIHWLGPINQVLSQFAALVRLLRGTFANPAMAPAKPLRFYAPERSVGGRLVKEMLCSKELEYLWASRAPDGQTTPRLEDPNTGRAVTGSFAILDYLRENFPPL
jgi:glutathione S-transferase